MNKRKVILLASLLLLSVGTVSTVFATSKGRSSFFSSVKGFNIYSLKFDKDNKIVDSQIKTKLGNNIWAKNGGVEWGTENLTFKKGAYIQNLSKLTGIYQVNIDLVSGSVDVLYGYSEPSDLTTPMYYAETVTESKIVTLNSTNVPDYVRVVSTTGAVVKSISFDYECANNTEPLKISNVDYELEMGYTKGENVYSSIIDGGMISDKCLRVVPDYDKSGDPALQLDLAKDIEKGLFVKTGKIRAFSVDFKDDNGVVSNNNRYEFMGQLETKAGNTGWMNPLSWSVDLGNGWRRSYYTTENDGYNVSDLKNLNIFLSKSRKNTSGDSLSSIYIDNVRLYDTNIADLNKMNVAKSQDAFDITGCKVEDGKIPTAVKFEIQKIEGKDFRFFIGKNWSDSTDYLKVMADMTTSSSAVSAKKLSNGWFEVTVDLFKASNNGQVTTNEFTLLDSRNGDGNNAKVCLGDLEFVYDYPLTMEAGKEYKFKPQIELNTVEDLVLEYHVEGTETELSHFEILTNDTYIGTYGLTNSSFQSYSNCKFEKLADGWVKLTMNMPSTTRVSAGWHTLEEYPAITSLKGFTIHGSWGDHKPVSIRNIEFVKKEAVEPDLLESESLIKKVYIDKLDHNPQVIEEVKSGVSITKEESIVATKGYSWKVTANVSEEVWDWVVFGLDNPVDIETLENISLKFVNAQKWAIFRFYDEDFNLISDSISADFSSGEWNSFERTVFHTRNVKYVGFCLHFYPNVENVVYIDALNVTYMPETYFCENKKDTFIEMPKININSGKKLVLTFTNIVKQGDDVGFRIIQDKDHPDVGYGKYCVECDYEVWNFGEYAGKWNASYTTGLSREVDAGKSCTITFDFEAMGQGKDQLTLPSEYVSCLYFKSNIMVADCNVQYAII